MTLILSAPTALSAPPAGAPIAALGDFTSGLLLDYDFDALRSTLANGATVASVTNTAGSMSVTLDQVGGASFAKPTLVHAGPGGHAALDFNGNQHLGTVQTSAAPQIIAEGAARTLVAVACVDAVTATGTDFQRLVGSGRNMSPTSYQAFGVNASGLPTNMAASAGSGATTTSGSGASRVGKWSVFAVTTDAAGDTVIRSTGNPSASAASRPGGISGLRLGSRLSSAPEASSFLDGKIARVMVFNRVLSAVDLDALELAMASRYAITP